MRSKKSNGKRGRVRRKEMTDCNIKIGIEQEV